MVKYSEWLEDRFDRGCDSPEAVAQSFLEEYSDLEPGDIEQALDELRVDLLRVVEGLDLAIAKARAKR